MIKYVKYIDGPQKGNVTIIDTEFDTWAYDHVLKHGMYVPVLRKNLVYIPQAEYDVAMEEYNKNKKES